MEEIKPALVEQLKAKYQVPFNNEQPNSFENIFSSEGKQSERGSAPEAEKAATALAVKADAGKIAELEAEVAAQGGKVFELIIIGYS